MKNKLFVIIITLFALFTGVYANESDPVTWNFSIKNTSDNSAEITLKATVERGWHIYSTKLPAGGPIPTKFVFENMKNAVADGKIIGNSKLHEEYDPMFEMKLGWYENQAVFVQKIQFTKVGDVAISGYVEYMACNDESCMPPQQVEFSLSTTAKAAVAPNENLQTSATLTAPEEAIVKTDTLPLANIQSADIENVDVDLWASVTDEMKALGEKTPEKSSLWWILVLGFGGGLIALVTPCVWPVIPMTVSFFLKRTKDKAQARKDAVLYGVAIVLIYVALGVIITLIFGSSALNNISTQAWFNIFLFVLLVVLAMSFFGMFEITMPSSWSNAMDSKAESTAGFVSILFMAFTLVLVSFSCTGPIIGFMLVEISSASSILAPLVAMFGFALALAIPFSLFAFFPSMLKSLPKSGGWLNTVKVVLAFIELALSLKFLSTADQAYHWHILDREVFLSLWIVIFSLLGFYLLGKIRFSHDDDVRHSSVVGTFLAIISLSFAVYMVPGLWGAPLKSISAFSPPLNTQDFNLYNKEVHPAFTDYEEGMAFAAKKKLPVVIDFTGYGCVNCRKMETAVWIDPAVKYALEKEFVLISLFVDDKTPLDKPYKIEENGKTFRISTVGDRWSYLQNKKFNYNAQPYYVILDNAGKPLNTSMTFNENPKEFVQWLNKG
ncbi:MAG: thioredoxin family protein, partial [Paludibacter sp.]|nr:thioredoxin family protein [Paludibacter sp.]